jgi:ribonuclease P protein component
VPDIAVDRLRDGRDVVATLRARSHRAGSTVVLHVRPTSLPVTRIAVLASRRVGNAVERNRAKRVLRAAARTVAWSPGNDVVLVARAETGTAGTRVVADELRELAARLDVVARPMAAPGVS